MSRDETQIIRKYVEGNIIYIIGEDGKRIEIEMTGDGQDRVIIDTLNKYTGGKNE